MADRLEGRTAVVVGGGQIPGPGIGNGRAAALAYAREGARVLVLDRDVDSAQETAELIGRDGGDARAAAVDISREADCEAIARIALDVLGHIDVLHNNVGVVLVGDTESLPVEHWRHGLDVNLTGMWATCKYVLPHMRERRRGVVTNISSLASLRPRVGAINYPVSKAAVNALTAALALEYAPYGVRVNAISPGKMETPNSTDAMARTTGETGDALRASRAASVPLGREGSAHDVANAAVFLASDEASYITGVVLPVDGGASLV
jgi:NAD(P)-dependent dehydrogenase (short-subunit alcohol dehydrogenase family)